MQIRSVQQSTIRIVLASILDRVFRNVCRNVLVNVLGSVLESVLSDRLGEFNSIQLRQYLGICWVYLETVMRVHLKVCIIACNQGYLED